MNSFDFSLYDPLDETPIRVKSKSKDISSDKEVKDFDFNQYDFTEDFLSPKKKLTLEENAAKKDKVYQQYASVDKTPEEIKSMSIGERQQYAQDLATEREYLQSAGFTKGALSGLTLGATENIDLLKPQEQELLTGLGEFAGSVAPIGLAAKAVSIPTKAVFKNAPKVLQPLRHFMQAFGTGATYETGKQGINALSNNEVDLSQIPIRGAEFATIDSLLRGGSKLAKSFSKLSPTHQAKILEDRIIPDNLPKSQYETAEEVLNQLRQVNQRPNNFPQPSGTPSPLPDGGGPARISPNRVKTNGKDLGLRPTAQPQRQDLSASVGDIFSNERFYNTTQGGQALKQEIMNIDEDIYRGVGELYNTSRALNSEINTIQPQLVNRLEARIAELSEIPEPSDVQKRLLRASKNVLKKLVEYENVLDESGKVIGREIVGYTPINNQTLIEQVQSLRQIIDYDFSHGNTKNIFRPLINDLQDAAIRSAEQMGHPEAAEALSEAKSAYKAWVGAFDNDYIRPFRDASNQDFSKLFKSSLDFDEFNMVRKILNLSEDGQRLGAASTREIVEKHLLKYFENPRSTTPKEFDKVIRELEAVITPEQAQQIRDQFRQAQGRAPFRARETPRRQPTNDEIIAAKYQGKEPEDVQNMMNRRSGIRQLREDLKTPKKRATFERLKLQKIRSIFREGNIDKEFTGDELYRFLNKEHNFELLSEMLGESETEALRQSAKEIGKKQIRSEVRKKNISKAANKVAVYKALEMIVSLI